MEQNMNQAPWGANAGYNTGFAGGYAYNGTPVAPKMTNPLKPEELEALKTNNRFTLNITPQELAEGICTHKDPKTGSYATVQNADGTVTCSICHQTFDPNKVANVEYVQNVVDEFVNVLQTCKLLGLDFNDEVIRGMFQMQPFVKKLPELFKMAQTSFARYNDASTYNYQVQNPNPWGLYNQMMVGQPMFMQPQMQQPVNYGTQPMGYGQQPQQPMGFGMPQQQPMMTPYANMQQQMVGGANPFYAAQPMTTMPMNGVALPGATQQPAQPPQAANNGEEKKDVSVSTQMGL